jgi:oligoendopeptidase F
MSTSLLDQLTTLLAYLNLPAKLDRVLANQEATMAAIDDLKSALAQLSTDIAAEIAALQAALTSNNDAAIEDAVTNMKALSAQLEASVAPKTPPQP